MFVCEFGIPELVCLILRIFKLPFPFRMIGDTVQSVGSSDPPQLAQLFAAATPQKLRPVGYGHWQAVPSTAGVLAQGG